MTLVIVESRLAAPRNFPSIPKSKLLQSSFSWVFYTHWGLAFLVWFGVAGSKSLETFLRKVHQIRPNLTLNKHLH